MNGNKKINIICIAIICICAFILGGIMIMQKDNGKAYNTNMNATAGINDDMLNIIDDGSLNEVNDNSSDDTEMPADDDNTISNESTITTPSNNLENTTDSDDENNSVAKSNEFVAPTYKKLSYGTSENGRDLTYYSIAPKNYTSTILMNFAIHGYEDAYNKDGQLLVDLAEYLKEYYLEKSDDEFYETRLLIIPCANPDGLYEGTTNNGFGRCNAKGIDLNRDFDAQHKVFNSVRNYTQSPFSAKESQAMRDLVYKENPDVVLDFHGWENCTIGDSELATIFKTHTGLGHRTSFNSNCNGYFSYWAHTQGATSLLVEFKNTNIPKTSVAETINELLEEF